MSRRWTDNAVYACTYCTDLIDGVMPRAGRSYDADGPGGGRPSRGPWLDRERPRQRERCRGSTGSDCRQAALPRSTYQVGRYLVQTLSSADAILTSPAPSRWLTDPGQMRGPLSHHADGVVTSLEVLPGPSLPVGAALPLPVVLFPLAIDEGSVRDIPGSSAFQVADGSCCPGFVESCAGGRTTWKLQRMEGMAVHYKAGTQGRLPQSETGTPSPGRSTVGRLAIRPLRAVDSYSQANWWGKPR